MSHQPTRPLDRMKRMQRPLLGRPQSRERIGRRR
jgi:hypothetical protein